MFGMLHPREGVCTLGTQCDILSPRGENHAASIVNVKT